MTKPTESVFDEFHWMMDVLRSIDVGLVVLDMDFNIKMWNSFMQNHSGMLPSDALEQNIFTLFPELPESWFRRKLRSVVVLQNAAFTTWEQRPYLFRFHNYRPVTGVAEFMYQNCTILPLTNTRGEVQHLCLIIYDVTEVAVNRIQLQQFSSTDGLTGLLNRKTWDQQITQEFKRYQRYRHPASLIMMDIDHFKKINDGFGHPAGDQVIRHTAELIAGSLRGCDIAARYGGEEFAIILTDTDVEGAKVVAERIRSSVEATEVVHDGKSIRFTVSLGINELNADVEQESTWVELADKALYNAKHGGRNQVMVYPAPAS